MHPRPRPRAAGAALLTAAIVGTTFASAVPAEADRAHPILGKPSAASGEFRDNGITAHRGYSAAYPENTMVALQKGIEVGADWIELDVFVSKDGQVVVNHDTTTGRTGNKNLVIAESTWSQLKTVDVSTEFRARYGLTTSEVPVMRMPLLSEVLTMVKKQHRTRVSIQPKTIPAVDAAVAVVQKHRMQEWVGFNDGSLPGMSRVKELDPSIHVFWDTNTADVDASIATALDRGFEAIVMNQSRVSPESIAKIQAAGLEAGAWTINDLGVMRDFWDWGIDRVYTDHAGEALIVTGQDQRTGTERDLLAHYSFEDHRAADRSGLTDGGSVNPVHDGRLVGDATVDRRGRDSGVLALDGWKDYVKVPIVVVPPAAPAVTAAAWFKPEDPASGRQTILETSGDWTVSIELAATTGHLKYSVRVPGSDVVAESAIIPAAGKWHHVAVAYDKAAATTRLYLDGKEVTDFPADGKDQLSPTGRLAPSTGLHIGTYRTADGRYFAGSLDDVALWNRALTSDEVAAMWKRGVGRSL